jgi:lipoprotein NlpI
MACAAAYDDFADGITAFERGDVQRAIVSLTAALDAPDLAPNLKVTAYLDRAKSYLASRQCALAAADINNAKSQGADDRAVTGLTAAVQYCARDFRSADATYTKMISVEPSAGLYFIRGRTRWAIADFAGAASDFAALNAANPKYPYSVIWLAVAEYRRGNPDLAALAKAAARLDTDAWPGPVIRLFLGTATVEDVIAAAANGEASALQNQQCEANFYVAEWWLAKSNAAGAKPLLQLATDKCPRTFIERDAAQIELEHLK